MVLLLPSIGYEGRRHHKLIAVFQVRAVDLHFAALTDVAADVLLRVRPAHKQRADLRAEVVRARARGPRKARRAGLSDQKTMKST